MRLEHNGKRAPECPACRAMHDLGAALTTLCNDAMSNGLSQGDTIEVVTRVLALGTVYSAAKGQEVEAAASVLTLATENISKMLAFKSKETDRERSTAEVDQLERMMKLSPPSKYEH